MSQRMPHPEGHHRPPLNIGGPSQPFHGTPGTSGFDGRPRPAGGDPYSLGDSTMASASYTGYFNTFSDIEALSTVQNPADLPADHTRFASFNFHLTHDQEAPWNQQNPRHWSQLEGLPSFTTYRAPAALSLSAGQSSVRSDFLPSDSGYETQTRKSFGVPSVHGDVDSTPAAVLNQLSGMQFENGSVHSSSQAPDSWNQDTQSQPPTFSRLANTQFPCTHCEREFKSKSDLRKHVNWHVRPYRCPELECVFRVKGFGTSNDLERHLRSVHNKIGTLYRCRLGTCQKKVKDWSRADNFRLHLKNVHHVVIDAGDSLDEYIVRSGLTNAEPSPAPTLVSNNGSVATTAWPATGQSTSVPREDLDMSGADSVVDPSELALPNSANESPTLASNLPVPSSPTHEQVQNDGSASEWTTGQTADQYLDDTFSIAQYGEEETEEHEPIASSDTSTGHFPLFVRPRDLASRTFLSDMPPSLPLPTAGGVEVLEIPDDDHDNSDDDDAGESMTPTPDGHGADMESEELGDGYNLDSVVAPQSPRLSSGEGSFLKPTDQPAARDMAGTSGHPEVMSKPGTSPSPGQTQVPTSQLLDVDGMDTEEVEGIIRKLMEKLDRSAVQKVCDDYLNPKEVPEKPTKPTSAPSSRPAPTIKCAHCVKMFARASEMKKHLKRHQKPFWCTRCPKQFGSKSDWIRHENSQHLQHEVWRCDEKLRGHAAGEACNKVCYRRETFRQHLKTHHETSESALEGKMESCRVWLGEARYWCGFCREVIENKHKGPEAGMKRFTHFDDHYHGRNGLAKKMPGDWQRDDTESQRSSEQDRPGASASRQPPVASVARGPESKKRGKHGSGQAAKKAKVSFPSRDLLLWQCCQCHGTWSYANNASCITCDNPRCSQCKLEEVEAKDDVMLPA